MAPPQNGPIVSFLAVGMFCMCAPLAFIIPNIQTRSALRHILNGTWKLPPGADPALFATAGSKLMMLRQTTMIVGLALLEGPAFMACISYLLEAQVFVLGLVGAAVILMLGKFPTEARIRAWLERQAAVLSDMRQEAESSSSEQ
jgi:hypothetical protein